jgi:hypothetical protein
MSLKTWFLRKFKYSWDITKPESDVYLRCIGRFYNDFEFDLRNRVAQQDLYKMSEGKTMDERLILMREHLLTLAMTSLRGTMEDLGCRPKR